jgi:predicted membrane-bound spermidine synthase
MRSGELTGEEGATRSAQLWLQNLFLLSGVAALAYQVCWQRILFFSFGTDIESITIVVSTFMLGLGLGALTGGWFADRYPKHIILMFAAAELGIGLFGLASPWLITWAGDLFVGSGHGATAVASFALLLIPTSLMGATLPMLVAHFLRVYGNVGLSVGQLYFVNTLGAALGCLGVGFLAFRFLTLIQVIYLAAAVNVFVSSTGFLKLRAR